MVCRYNLALKELRDPLKDHKEGRSERVEGSIIRLGLRAQH